MTHYYDLFGQPTTTLDGNYRYVSYYHDDAGNLIRFTHADGVNFGYSYDALGRMTQVNDHFQAASTDDLIVRYWYNPAGNRYSAVRGAGAVGFYSVYYRDALERVTVLANDLAGTANDAPTELGCNPASQIVTRVVHNDAYAAPPEANRSLAYHVNGLNQYSQVSNRTYAYDPNGNLTSDGTTSYVYDVENRLVSASGETNATLVYDPLGRLVQTSGPAGPTTYFLYDGDRIVAEYDGAGNLTKRYAHGPGADEPVAVYEGAALGLASRRYMLPDERGSIVALVDANGTPSAINRYDAWGVPGAGNGGRFQYTGQIWIPELRLYYYKARFYSPTLGRFLQVDPIGYDGGINLYAYVGNDPVSKIDPSGASGVLTIYANQYHAWLGYQKDGRTSPATWGRFERGYGGGLPGVQTNTERDKNYPWVERRQVRLTDAGEQRLFGYVSEEIKDTGWEFWNNCVDFAEGGWTALTGERFEDQWGPQTPGSLINQLQEMNQQKPSTRGLFSLPRVAAEKGYTSVIVNRDGTITGRYVETGSRLPRSITCNSEGKCSP